MLFLKYSQQLFSSSRDKDNNKIIVIMDKLPIELVRHHILLYDGRIRYRSGKYRKTTQDIHFYPHFQK